MAPRPSRDGDEYACDTRARGPPVSGVPKLRGVNLGGWLVLTPWITPSLFYQFEGQKGPDKVAMDMHGFCKVLGAVEANRQLREHWRRWVTSRDLADLAAQGVNAVRIPVGDWMWLPYEPFIGCTDGALDELWRVIHACQKLKIKVLVDLHAVRGSQNGFDNSGHARNITWADGDNFAHWPTRSTGWQGAFDPMTMTYASINWDSIRATVGVLQRIATSLRHFPAVVGIEALNEPWQYTPLDVLKAFYWDAYWAIRAAAPHWLLVVHDSFRLDAWGGFMRGCEGVVLDTHVYQAWFDIRSRDSFLDNACSWRQRIYDARAAGGLPVLVGEWSLATDNCMMWLNGFHDDAPGYPKVQCDSVDCPAPYVSGIAGPPSGPTLGPRGTGKVSAPNRGKCPTSKAWPDEDSFEPLLAAHKISAFEEGAGWFYMNFKSEIRGRWSWEDARRWMPPNVSNISSDVLETCAAMDVGHHPVPADHSGDLPWYDALPNGDDGTLTVVRLMGIGLGALLAIAVILMLALKFIARHASGVSISRLQLPPRLLKLARKSQKRKSTGAGRGILGLRHRISSRSLARLAFPLMQAENAINESDEDGYGSTPSSLRPPGRSKGHTPVLGPSGSSPPDLMGHVPPLPLSSAQPTPPQLAAAAAMAADTPPLFALQLPPGASRGQPSPPGAAARAAEMRPAPGADDPHPCRDAAKSL